MHMHRSFHAFLPCVALLFALGLAPVASAQQTIPSEVITAASIDAQQQQAIAGAVAPIAAKLDKGSDDDVAAARVEMMNLFERARTLGGTPAFSAALSGEVARALAGAMQTDRVICRLNAMLIAGQVQSPRVVPLLLSGLKDSAPAVRYAAAKSLYTLLTLNNGEPAANVFDADAYTGLINGLGEAMSGAANEALVREAFLALAKIPVPDARQKTLDILMRRAAMLQTTPDLTASLAGETDALRTVVLFYATQGDYSRARQLAEAGLAYLVISVRDLQTGKLDVNARKQRQLLVQVGLTAAEFAAKEASSVTPLQTPEAAAEIERLKTTVKMSNWLEAQLHGQQLLDLVK